MLSSYIIEPFFTRPVEVVARWIAIFLFLLGIQAKEQFLLFDYWIVISLIFIALALLVIVMHKSAKFEKSLKILTSIICKISRPEIVFSFLYFFLVISYFRDKTLELPLLLGFGFLMMINKPVDSFVLWVSTVFTKKTSNYTIAGKIIGYRNEDFFNVEIDLNTKKLPNSLVGQLIGVENKKSLTLGIVINEKSLVGKKWILARLIKDENSNTIAFNTNTEALFNEGKTVFNQENGVTFLKRDDIPTKINELISKHKIISNYNNLVGFIWSGSSISKIKFYSMINDDLIISKGIGEGSIIQSKIANEEVLFQIIDANTAEENLELKDSHGFKIATAQKLGKYDFSSNELSTVKWVPDIYEPVFLLEPEKITYEARKFIGKLPKTNYGIPIKNIDELVTHNTAILGILGIGKSCLTFELIQKLIESTNVKIVCIDITNEYHKPDKLPLYVDTNILLNDSKDAFNSINSRYNFIDVSNNKQNPDTSGNISEYHTEIASDLKKFMFDSDTIPEDFNFSNSKRIRIYNPDYHKVSRGEKIGYNVITTPLTQAEKTRVICEEILKLLMKLPIKDSGNAKLLVVFEEAHSLVPEWNSVANDGDKNATNGTAKVILQGRKYGLGSMVITQRTANISKSILNQCNTIFALRVFDDTGKQFLENYIGSDYSNLLPTLEERHAVVIGKALKLKQPVIIELNDRDLLIKKETVTDTSNDISGENEQQT
ncbi:MAG: DUF87 domain-containing protein [Ignavibacteriaceae bacterium]|nr:DUF87 domain-containing protein [Ignavibacteriaceae bacterium]